MKIAIEFADVIIRETTDNSLVSFTGLHKNVFETDGL